MQFISSIKKFIRDEEGAQVVEYALVIALVSIGLAVAVSKGDLGITAWMGKVKACLGGTCS